MAIQQSIHHNFTISSLFTRLLEPCIGLLVSTITPPACRHCGTALTGHANPYLCPQCISELKWIGSGACRGCGYPAGPHAELGKSCRHCRGRNHALTSVVAAVRYSKGARSLIRALKFRSETELAKPLAEIMTERAKAFPFPRIDLALPVPLHPSRKRSRGFNQAELLAERVAAGLAIPVNTNTIRKIRPTPPQSALARSDRLENVQGLYTAVGDLTGKSILLVDDVITTGATMNECAQALRSVGAKHVYGLAFAR